ncbi:MAG: flagellar biosynthesis anti-sigma factor FlgM [Oscillospiraceae bacterium]|nr:flagellar biosynthesis anti-sigma factor FlgM [Oscillospiraceae bacterium]
MTIKNLSSAVNAYRYNTEPAERKRRTAGRSASGRNVDKFDFSGTESAGNARASFADTLRMAARSAADSAASPERIKALNTAVKDGSYNVSAEDVADSILGL